jgi:hypothetical protein
MNELHFAYRVKQHLNRGLQQIDDDQLGRLKAAREQALAAQKQPAASPILAGSGHFFRFHLDGVRPRHVVAGLLLALIVALFVQWHADQLISELTDVDSALLSEDLPVEALLDNGFDKWLRDSPEQ